MDSRLLAFRVARPIEDSGDGLIEFSYDPRSQTAVWKGSSKALAVLHCSSGGSGGGKHCNAYGNYCTTYGGAGKMYCDG